MRIRQSFYLFLFFLPGFSGFSAPDKKLCVHNFFQTNMVLQRDKPVSVRGWADPGEKVTVKFSGHKKKVTTAEDASWKATFPSMTINRTPQTMTIKGKNKTIVLENILLGDIWLLGGQSNMEEPIQNVEGGIREVVSANFPQIRLLTIPQEEGPEVHDNFPKNSEDGNWNVCSPQTVRRMSAIGYIFARRLYMATEVPLGVIDTSRGGTTIETWTPMDVLKEINTREVKTKLAEWKRKIAEYNPQKDLEQRIGEYNEWLEEEKKMGRTPGPDQKPPCKLLPGPARDRNRPGNCYNSMICPIAGMRIKGIIFHQGFNNAFEGSAGTDRYYQIFGKMITAWRTTFDDPDLPFGIISLCTAGTHQRKDNFVEMMFDAGIYIREAQYKTFLDFYESGDKNIGFASSFDKRRSWFHPTEKISIGERISSWALATQYDRLQNIHWLPPRLKEFKVKDGSIHLFFDRMVEAVSDNQVNGFAIAGKDRRFYPAKVENIITGQNRHGEPEYEPDAFALSNPLVKKPIHFRYAWGRNPMGNLVTEKMVPFATQRSDSWKMEEVPQKLNIREKSQRNNMIKRDLRLSDMERRLKNAKAFIRKFEEGINQERKQLEEEKSREN